MFKKFGSGSALYVINNAGIFSLMCNKCRSLNNLKKDKLKAATKDYPRKSNSTEMGELYL